MRRLLTWHGAAVAVDGDDVAGAKRDGGVGEADDRRHAVLAGEDGEVAERAAGLGDESGEARDDRGEPRVEVADHEHAAGRHVAVRACDVHRAGGDPAAGTHRVGGGALAGPSRPAGAAQRGRRRRGGSGQGASGPPARPTRCGRTTPGAGRRRRARRGGGGGRRRGRRRRPTSTSRRPSSHAARPSAPGPTGRAGAAPRGRWRRDRATSVRRSS